MQRLKCTVAESDGHRRVYNHIAEIAGLLAQDLLFLFRLITR